MNTIHEDPADLPPPPPRPQGLRPAPEHASYQNLGAISKKRNWRENVKAGPPGYDSATPTETTASSRASNPPISTPTETISSSGSDSEYESDWEKEITEEGEVFYVLPASEDEDEGQRESKQSEGLPPPPPAPPTRPPAKKSGKLSRLVRRRESKRDRSVLGNGSNGYANQQIKSSLSPNAVRESGQGQESSDNDSSTYYGQLKTFESVFEDAGAERVEMHEVTLRIKGRKHVAAGASLTEAMMGVIPVRHGLGGEEASQPHLTNVVVAGYLTGGPAIKVSERLHIGDVIRLVDGQQVNLATIEQMLSTYSSSTKIKLTVQRPSKKLPLLNVDNSSSSAGSESLMRSPPTLARVFERVNLPSKNDSNAILKETIALLKPLPYLALYTTRTGILETSPELADILYQFPPRSSKQSTQEDSSDSSSTLMKVRGLFVTLCQALPEVTGSKPIVASVMVEDQLVNVGFAEEREDTLIIALPANKCSNKAVCQIVRDAVRVLRTRHQTLSNAFRNCSGKSPHSLRNLEDLNRFFSGLFLNELLGGGSAKSADISAILGPIPAKFDENFPAAQWLPLPDEIKFQVDDALNQFESADFQDYSDEFYDLPREFNIVGSCIFHKGLILSSHLPRDDMVDILLWCKFRRLFSLTIKQPVDQIVAWSEIYLTRKGFQRATAQRQTSPGPPDRTFLLVVGQGHQLLGVLLSTGNCTTKPVGPVRPDPFYVDQAMNTLDHLEDMGIPVVCDRWLTLPANPDIVNVDKLYESVTSAGAGQGGGSSRRGGAEPGVLSGTSLGGANNLPEKGIILRKTKAVDYSSASSPTESEEINSLHKSENSELSEELQTAFREDPTTEIGSSVWDYHRHGQTAVGNRETKDDSADEFVTYQVSQLTVSPENTLFHYVHLEVGQGVFLSPLSPPATPLHSELLENFRASCQIIHSTLQMSLKARELLRAQNKGQGQKPCWLNKSLVAVKEQGVLFQWSPLGGATALQAGSVRQQQLPVLSYWVCGRLFLGPDPKECYVCYHESAPQSMVELAFKMAHGIHI